MEVAHRAGLRYDGLAAAAMAEGSEAAMAARRLLAAGERSANGLPAPAGELTGDVAAVLRLTAKNAEDRSVLRATQSTLASVVDCRTQHLRRLKDVLTVNKRLEEKLCAADEHIATMQAQNDALESELMRLESAKVPPAPPPDPSALLKTSAELLARVEYMDACALKIQRICRGWLGRRRALRQAELITSVM